MFATTQQLHFVGAYVFMYVPFVSLVLFIVFHYKKWDGEDLLRFSWVKYFLSPHVVPKTEKNMSLVNHSILPWTLFVFIAAESAILHPHTKTQLFAQLSLLFIYFAIEWGSKRKDAHAVRQQTMKTENNSAARAVLCSTPTIDLLASCLIFILSSCINT